MANDGGFLRSFMHWEEVFYFQHILKILVKNMIYGKIFTHQYFVLLSNLVKVLLIGSWVIAPCGFNGRFF